jgi:hypothetical protein
VCKRGITKAGCTYILEALWRTWKNAFFFNVYCFKTLNYYLRKYNFKVLPLQTYMLGGSPIPRYGAVEKAGLDMEGSSGYTE